MKVHYMIENNYESFWLAHQVVSFCGRKMDKYDDRKRLTIKIDKVTCKKCEAILKS